MRQSVANIADTFIGPLRVDTDLLTTAVVVFALINVCNMNKKILDQANIDNQPSVFPVNQYYHAYVTATF